MDDKVKSRIINWKFLQAFKYYKEEPEDEVLFNLLKALSLKYEDSGWIRGNEGDFLGALVKYIIDRETS